MGLEANLSLWGFVSNHNKVAPWSIPPFGGFKEKINIRLSM